jgi:hypothetical protein
MALNVKRTKKSFPAFPGYTLESDPVFGKINNQNTQAYFLLR